MRWCSSTFPSDGQRLRQRRGGRAKPLRGEDVNADLVSTGRVDVDLQLDPLTRPDPSNDLRNTQSPACKEDNHTTPADLGLPSTNPQVPAPGPPLPLLVASSTERSGWHLVAAGTATF